VRHVVISRRLGALYAAALGAMYGLLYAILGAEDYALLMGALVVFGVLGAVMVLTRQVNWAQFGKAVEVGASTPERS